MAKGQLPLFTEGKPSSSAPALAPGFEVGPLAGTVVPTFGSHKGVPMLPDSALYLALAKRGCA